MVLDLPVHPESKESMRADWTLSIARISIIEQRRESVKVCDVEGKDEQEGVVQSY